MEWKQALEEAVHKTTKNIERFNGLFPHVSENQTYHLIDNNEWTNGFWSGILWLCYEYSGDKQFKEAAELTVESFQQRMDNKVSLDHHDIGFLYSLSSKAQWMIEKNEQARQLTIAAADALMKRWRPKGQYIQAWGPEGDPENGGRIIIDCMLNLPLLYWASEQTGDPSYKEAATIHAEKTRRYILRGDDSSYHTFFLDPETGNPLGGGTHQGYQDGSTWTRGQAWAIYGFALAYVYTKNPLYLESAKRTARHFVERLPEDSVAYWDFCAPVNSLTKRDSSASAIAACGMLEIVSHLDDSDPDRVYFQEATERSMKSLVENYATERESEGLLDHGSYCIRRGESPDDYMIWGDYYYIEALMRLEKGHKGYWYESTKPKLAAY